MTDNKTNQNVSSVVEKVNPKFLGIYPQKQEGKFMQRIKVPGGKITWQQWRALAQIAKDYTPNTGLHLTTRQDIELHNVDGADSEKVLERIGQSGLTTLGAGGDSLRNVTVCSPSGLKTGSFDMFELAELIGDFLQSQPVAGNLPRKFKVSLSCCKDSCAKPYISDIGFVAQDDGRLTVTVAGSLGARPGLAIEFLRDLDASDALPLCNAALDMFAEHGDRENRRKARFRHIRERFGDEKFVAELVERFELKKAERSWSDVVLKKNTEGTPLIARIQLIGGDISADEAIALVDSAQPAGAILRIDLCHGLELYGDTEFDLPEGLDKLKNKPKVIACPGLRTCPNGLADCKSTAAAILDKLTDGLGKDVTINISGCPNNCVHSAIADIGLVGAVRTIGSERVACYQILTGGGNGTNNVLATKQKVVTAQEVPTVIEEMLKSND